MESKNARRFALLLLLCCALLPAGCKAPPSTEGESEARKNALLAQDPLIPPPPDVAAVPADAPRTASGLAWKRLRQGKGTVSPRGVDAVRVHYNSWTPAGTLVDSSFKKGRASIFILDDIIVGLSEGLRLMAEGDACRFWIPAALAQGAATPGGSFLVYDVELLAVVRAPDRPPTADLAAPPRDAGKTKSGIAWKVLRNGVGFAHPDAQSVVALRYTGWAAEDEKWSDSNFARPIPSLFTMNEVIPGWAEGLRLMAPGEKRRLWIPGGLAYKGLEGKPQGTVVYDLELVEIRQQGQ